MKIMDKMRKIKSIGIKTKKEKKENKESDKKKLKNLKKPGRKRSIGRKINTLAISIIIIMMALMLVLGFQALRFSNEYSGVLDNISNVTYIKTNVSPMATTITNLCNFGGSISESGYIEDIEKMNQYITEIEQNIGEDIQYNQNKNQLAQVRASLERYTQAFNDLRAACGDDFSSAGSEFAAKMSSEASFTALNAETLMTYEVNRSQVVQNEIKMSFRNMIIVLIILVILVGLISTLIAFRVSRGITHPMKELQSKLDILSKGDLTGEDIEISTNDETRELAIAFNQMKKNLTDIIEQVSKGTLQMQMATETVDVSISENAKGSQQISEAIDQMLGRLEQQTTEAKSIMEQVAQMGTISEEVSKSAENIHLSSNDSLVKAGVGSENISAYVKQMATVNDTMNAMAEVFRSFSDSTKKMNTILGSITEIAEQTNLLSLNASIEAARAGDAGRGFAVVATEIRKLADDSQNAAQQIGGMITAVQKDADSMSSKLKESLTQLDKGNELAEETRSSFELIKNGTEVVNADVGEIISKIQNLSEMMNQTIDGVQLIHNAADGNVSEINDINAIVTEEVANQEEVSATTTTLANLARELEEHVSGFTLNPEMEEVLGEILMNWTTGASGYAEDDTSDASDSDLEVEIEETDNAEEINDVAVMEEELNGDSKSI